MMVPKSRCAVAAALACMLAGCGGEEAFEPTLATNERLIEQSSALLVTKDHKFFDIAVVGDLDGDGIDDAAIAAYSFLEAGPEARHRGVVYVRYGGPALPGDMIELDTLPQLTDIVWASLHPVGDVDGDGLADLLVFHRTIACGTPNTTGVYLVYGNATRLSGAAELRDAAAVHLAAPCAANVDVTGVGDLDGDGRDDLAIVTSDVGISDKEVFVLYGRAARLSGTLDLHAAADATITVPVAVEDLTGLDPLGDVDGDDHDDVAFHLARPHPQAVVRLIPGSATRLSGAVALDDLAHVDLSGTLSEYCGAGSQAAPLGDLDGDGFGDFALGTCHPVLDDPDGSLELGSTIFYGRSGGLSAPLSFDDAAATVRPGQSSLDAPAAGDFDGDGHRDLITTDDSAHDRNGAAYLVRGTGTRPSGVVDPRIAGTSYIGRTRHGVRCSEISDPNCEVNAVVGRMLAVGDLTGDGRDDALVEAPGTPMMLLPRLGVPGSSEARLYLLTIPGE